MRALPIATLRRTTGLLPGSAAFILILALLTAGVGTTLRRAHAQDAPDAPQTVFTNSTPIIINDASTATPYPSNIMVSGLGNSIPATAGSVQVTLNGFSHTFSDDVGMVLVGPTGAALLIQDGAGDDPDMDNVTYTLSDTGATVLPDTAAWTAGTYKPTTYFAGDPFPAPGPGTNYANPGPVGGTATFSSVFGGTNPNGVWHLYVVDFVTGDAGSISGGWSLTVNAGTVVIPQHVRDFDNDGKTDFAVFRPSNSVWYINRSSDDVLQSVQFGLSTDVLVEADYDGDQKTDIAVFRGGVWYLQRTTAGFTAVQFGQQGDIAAPADYDGDGKADIAVWRAGQPSSVYYILQSTTGTVRIDVFGQIGDKPVPGDYDGDGKADPAVYRNGTAQNPQSFWYYRASTGPLSGQIIGTQWGTTGDIAVPGDYNGDGKIDNAVFRPSTSVWYLLHSNTGIITAQKWGQAGDKVVQGDYDGDGKTDIAVWRDSNGVFYTIDSSTGQPFANGSNETNRVKQFGQSGDDALAYVPEQ